MKSEQKKFRGPIIAAVLVIAALIGTMIYFGRTDPQLCGKIAIAALLLVFIVLFALNLVLIILFLLGITAIDNAKNNISAGLLTFNGKVQEAAPLIDDALNQAMDPIIKLLAGKAGIKSVISKLFPASDSETDSAN